MGYAQTPSDDGKFALVEFVARDAAAFSEILHDSQVKAFLKGRRSAFPQYLWPPERADLGGYVLHPVLPGPRDWHGGGRHRHGQSFRPVIQRWRQRRGERGGQQRLPVFGF
jgi:hypothetical protein